MKQKHPKELFLLASCELCERYTFWGTGNLIVLYMIQHYHASAATAAHTYGIFSGFAAFLPLLGGFIADRWNYSKPLFYGALINAIGCFLIAFGIPSLFVVALGIMALGYGFFTPSILTLLGYTYRDRPGLREAGFSIYYASINIGVFLAMVSLGIVAKTMGWSYAFILAGLVQLFGLIPIFIYLKKHHVKYIDLHPRKAKKLGEDTKLTKIQKDRIKVILVLIIFSLLFWIPYIQGSSSMSVFGLKYTDRYIGSFQMPTAWLLSAEPFFLIVLAPILATLYAFLQKRGKNPSAPMKTAISLFSMCLCFLIMMFASRTIGSFAKSADISFFYPIIAYFFMAVGEMLLAPIGLSLVAHLSPKKYTALLIGFWYVSVGISFYIGGLLAGLVQKLPKLYDFFSIFAIMTIIPAILLLFLTKKLNLMSHKKDF